MASPTPQVYIPAVEPLAFRVMSYISVIQLTAYSYDWLLSIPGEHKVISRAGLNWSITIYLLSRITTFIHLLLIAIFVFAPVEHCKSLIALLATCAATRAISTSFMFFLRVRAVYLRLRSVTALFGILWLITATLNIITDVSIRVAPPTQAQRCLSYQIHYSTYPSISSFAFDTCVFLAISYRLAADAATEQSWRARLQSVLTGKGLLRLSRALMISGQLYYLAIILFFWVNFAVAVSPLIPVSSHYVLNTPYIMFTNVMACRVFRGVALGMLEKSPTIAAGLSSTRIAAAFELAPVPTVPADRDTSSQVA
ncbi:hypothetical protein FIBSPDRAFT_1052649 [Athelia psychrophila]|uniref:G-protein coupled receptors family 1 profile domain-containing protein n=1 Tax=Athelia psychrophila TaxID=1759441 RepID=A0A167VLM8_9AGAM|nr:hypothetical protein FIBSPDRAFT_1054268 [Fibularhizoctonia sp. CBS 109695]KZP07982.1 hypothetical protein FIBSPDRAFT_1052649 [Fibularhizoctonia sp. CBS 109695]